MEHIYHKQQNGFTLVEILLYLSLSVVMVALIGGIGVNVLSGLTSSKAEEELQYNSQFVTEKIRSYVAAAESVEVPSARATSSSLTLRMSDPAKDPTVINVFEGRVRAQEGAEEPVLLSGDGVVVLNPEFSNVTYERGLGSVRIVLPIGIIDSANAPILGASTTLYTTANLQYP